ncbi:MAG TPA: 2-amino-4-hydroxy-6-hydroxymethyldihydropteridine diphosphokinase [Metalysinibacillus jejuensis]|uniref:2-amino-4-hydroxy-6-hydroxymethyldihydropteridine diphosphokinase n=1 Tax=Metalysinibacillus jejuensis TaxID=914327 RepID=A0A921N927_9BACL|nr:2-amino-4-hydroxy-6-hydroxymethyldihydropteridine diphosphokinase [Metalysinibacillus jejuensis]HJH10092.1 2-amino-4-hydroxy-6-hydroxymethyldihydropteridine diphosphokinase [Metalysinibacillus jejuensis]
MNDVYLSIGTNIGEREDNLRRAVRLLAEQVTVETVSAVYETAAVGFTDQADFLNIAVHVKTALSPLAMLDVCQAIENELGRVRTVRWGPRVIDLDILLYNNENMNTERLILPHPRMYERAFVLIPLFDVVATQSEQLTKARDIVMQMDANTEGVRHVMQQQSIPSWLK